MKRYKNMIYINMFFFYIKKVYYVLKYYSGVIYLYMFLIVLLECMFNDI